MADEVVIVVKAEDNFSGVLGNFGNIMTGLKSVLDLAGDAFRFFKDYALEGLDAIAQYERLSITFESLAASQLLMSGAAKDMNSALEVTVGLGEELLTWSQELALQSPFTQQGVATAFQMAMAYGFNVEESKRLTEAMLDYSAATGNTEFAMERIARALGQISAAGKLTAQDINQLVAVGVPVNQILADAFDVTTQEVVKMRSEGLIPAQEAIEAITVWMETNFAGAGARMTETWAGLINTLGELKEIALREFFTGIFEALQPLVTEFANWLRFEGIEKLREIGERVGAFISDFTLLASIIGNVLIGNFEGLLQKLNEIGMVGVPGMREFSDLLFNLENLDLSTTIDIFNAFFQNITGISVFDIVQDISNLFGIFAAGGIATAILPVLAETAQMFIFVGGTIATQFATVQTMPVIAFFTGLLDVTAPLVAALSSLTLGVVGLGVGLGVLSQITDGLVPTLDEIGKMFLSWVDSIDWGQLSNDIANSINSIDWGLVGNQIAEGLGYIVIAIGQMLSEIDWAALLGSIGTAILDLIAGLFGNVSWDAMIADAKVGFEYVGRSIIDALRYAVNESWNNWVAIFSFGWDDLIRIVKNKLGISSPSTVFMSIARNIVQGLIDGWNTLFDTFLDLVGAGIEAILELFAPFLALFGVDIGSVTGGGTTGGGTNTGPGGETSPTSGQVVNNYFYGTVYIGSSLDDANYDCPSPNPLVAASGNQLVTTGY